MQSRMNNTGYFVAVDGPNGSGKTTVINAIAEKLGLMGYKVKVTREPTNSILGEFVRKYAEGHKGLKQIYHMYFLLGRTSSITQLPFREE